MISAGRVPSLRSTCPTCDRRQRRGANPASHTTRAAPQVRVGGVPLSTFQLELGLTANVYVQLLNVEKQVVRSSPSSPAITVPLDPEALGDHVRTFSSVEVESEHLRVLTVPVRRAGGDDGLGYVQLGASLER